jgi:hypothetical protein
MLSPPRNNSSGSRLRDHANEEQEGTEKTETGKGLPSIDMHRPHYPVRVQRCDIGLASFPSLCFLCCLLFH